MPADDDTIQRQNIFLVGMPGVGKTTIGRLLAAKLARPFVDLDRCIRDEDGREISEIIAADGERSFRELETLMLSRVVNTSGQVVATGGGTVLSPHNLRLMSQTGRLICLTAAIDELWRRLQLTKMKSRPLLGLMPDISSLRKLFIARIGIYASIALQYDTTSKTVEVVVADLANILN